MVRMAITVRPLLLCRVLVSKVISLVMCFIVFSRFVYICDNLAAKSDNDDAWMDARRLLSSLLRVKFSPLYPPQTALTGSLSSILRNELLMTAAERMRLYSGLTAWLRGLDDELKCRNIMFLLFIFVFRLFSDTDSCVWGAGAKHEQNYGDDHDRQSSFIASHRTCGED
jgi:hypothetical protein